MIYQLNNTELEQIAKIYKIDVNLLVEKIQFQDDIISFLPFEKGVELKTKNTQNIILRFKDRFA